MSVVVPTLLTLACLAGLTIIRRGLRRQGIDADEIGRRTLATPVGLICFWGAIVSAAAAITALTGQLLFGSG